MRKALVALGVLAVSAASVAGATQASAVCEGDAATARVCVDERRESDAGTRYDYVFVESAASPYGYASGGVQTFESGHQRSWSASAPFLYVGQQERADDTSMAGTDTVVQAGVSVFQRHDGDGCVVVASAAGVDHRQDCAGAEIPFVDLPPLP